LYNMAKRSRLLRIWSLSRYQKALAFKGLTIVYFFMYWARPCWEINAVLEKAARQYDREKLRIIKLEVDTIPSLSKEMKVAMVPCLHFFIDGKESGKKIIGVKEESVIIDRINVELKNII
jgi:thioredoxin-like negative regulator of GroEL